MNPDNLTVSWKRPSQLFDNLREYVVQYKEVGSPPGQAFDWVKVDKSQTRAFFRGTFEYLSMFDIVIETVNEKYCLYLLCLVVPDILFSHPRQSWRPFNPQIIHFLKLHFCVGLGLAGESWLYPNLWLHLQDNLKIIQPSKCHCFQYCKGMKSITFHQILHILLREASICALFWFFL